MVIGACRVVLHLPENQSLKGKRQVVKSIIERVRARFAVAIAEVEAQDSWQVAVLGLACVSNEPSHANEVLSKAIAFIGNSRLEAQLAHYEIEIVHLW